jgi:hypothetical protein
MNTTLSTETAAPLADRSFGELRCRRYLFNRDWWDQLPPVADPRAASGAAPAGPGPGPEPR